MQMGYKMIALDLDGTLLNPYLQISERNLKILKQAVNNGTLVTLSTGRMFAAALPFAELLELDVPIITCNGAAIVCAKSRKVSYERILSPELVLSILNRAAELELEISLYSADDIYVENIKHNARFHAEIDNATVKQAKLQDIARESRVIKILFSSENLYEHAEDVYRRFEHDCTFYFSLPWFVEIVAPGVDKGDALQKLSGQFGIDRKEIIAIGDNFNDLPMIQYAGMGVAMGNAPEDLKMMADYVTRSHNDDGVAHVIEKFVLEDNPAYKY